MVTQKITAAAISLFIFTPHPVGSSGSADYRRQVPQSTLTQALGVALAGFRKVDDLPSERLTKWIGVGEGGAARRERHLKMQYPLGDSIRYDAERDQNRT
jgi:hypothetical protein